MNSGAGGNSAVRLRWLTRNAYRILGLPASATQDQVQQAAAARRRDVKLGIARKTDWDLPQLGPVARSEADVQDALARLTHGPTRVRERLLWFWGPRPPEAPLERWDAPLPPGPSPAAPAGGRAHDTALARLAAAEGLDPAVRRPALWKDALQGWRGLDRCDDYWSAVVRLEETSFEPPAADAVEALRRAAVEVPLARLGDLAVEAMTPGGGGGGAEAGCRAIEVLAACGLPPQPAEAQRGRILDAIEEDLAARCDAVERELAPVRREEDADAETVRANLEACGRAAGRADRELLPAVDALRRLAPGAGEHWLRRVREAGADAVRSVALAYTWGDDFLAAARLMRRAAELAPPETVAGLRIAKDQTGILRGAVAAFEARCGRCRHDCGKWVRRDDAAAAHNRTVCADAARYATGHLEPEFRELQALLPDGSTELRGAARDALAQCLLGLAVDWTWADDFVAAEGLMTEARRLAVDPGLLGRIDEQTAKVAAAASRQRFDRQRAGQAGTRAAPTDAPGTARHDRPAAARPVPGPGTPGADGRGDSGGGRRALPWIALGLGGAAALALVAYFAGWGPAGGAPSSPAATPTATVAPAPPAVSAPYQPAARTSYTPPSYTPPAYTPPPPTVAAPTTYRPAIARDAVTESLKAEIENRRTRIADAESRLQGMRERLEALDRRLDAGRQVVERYERQSTAGLAVNRAAYRSALDDYNALVPEYNSLLRDHNVLRASYKELLDEHNALVDQYNARIGR